MKVLYVNTSRNEKILNIGASLRNLGIEGVPIIIDYFEDVCSYFMHKMDKWGMRSKILAYNKRQCEAIKKAVEQEKPDAVIIFNGVYSKELKDYWQELANKCRVVTFFVDSIKGQDEQADAQSFVGNHVFVYDYADILYLSARNIKAQYCHVGYNANYVYRECDKVFDVVFVGTPTGNRVEYLDALARYGHGKGWKMLFVGPFYEHRYFWKKTAFYYRYPVLYKYVRNETMMPDEVADLYRQAKICLNIDGGNGLDNLNPRTFEIMAVKGFQIMSRHDNYHGMIEAGTDFIDFASKEEMLEKAEYYLEHESERKKIASQGYEKTVKLYSIENTLKILLNI